MDQITAENRARWLAELADTIAKAQKLVWRMSAEGDLTSDGLDLLARLEFARVEVEALRCNGWARPLRNFPTNWIEMPTATHSPGEP